MAIYCNGLSDRRRFSQLFPNRHDGNWYGYHARMGFTNDYAQSVPNREVAVQRSLSTRNG